MYAQICVGLESRAGFVLIRNGKENGSCPRIASLGTEGLDKVETIPFWSRTWGYY